jgi:hypothetical protein
VARRQLAADVPELLEVVMLGTLRGLDAERRIAARAAAVRQLVAQLFFDRKCEKLMKAVEASIDELFVDAVVLDDDEPLLLVGRGNIPGKPRGFGLTRIECGNFVVHVSGIVPTAYRM